MKSETIKKRDVQLHIKKDGFFSLHIEGSEASQLLITVDKHISASLYITYHGDIMENMNKITIKCNLYQRKLKSVVFILKSTKYLK